MIEHLFDTINFLHTIAEKSECEFFVVTVPYLNRSSVGLHQIRNPDYLLKNHLMLNQRIYLNFNRQI